jgi:hypothetical protein
MSGNEAIFPQRKAVEEGGEGLCHTTIIPLLPDVVLPCQHGKTVLIHETGQLLQHEQQVSLHQANGNGGTDCGEDPEARCIGDGLFAALFLLLGLPLLIAAGWLLRVVNRACGVGAYLLNGADIASFGDDGVGGELARFELGPLRTRLSISAYRRGWPCICCAVIPGYPLSARRRRC